MKHICPECQTVIERSPGYAYCEKCPGHQLLTTYESWLELRVHALEAAADRSSDVNQLVMTAEKIDANTPTLLDRFAMAALSGLQNADEPAFVVGYCYDIARAMMAERTKKE